MLRVVAAVLLPWAALGLQMVAEEHLRYRSPFSFFYIAVLVSALLWGTVAGVVTAVVGGALVAIFIFEPAGTVRLPHAVEETEFILFVLVAGAIILVVDNLRRAVDRSRRLGRELERQRDTLEEMVRQRTRELEQTHERARLNERMAAVGSLAAGLAHDLGNLIMPMRMRLDSLRAQGLADRAREDVGVLSMSVDYLRSLAHGLRLFARDPQHAEPDELTQPAKWLADTLPFFRNVLPREIDLQTDVPEDLPDLAVAPHRLTQAVINLIGNARDAIIGMNAGGEACGQGAAGPGAGGGRGACVQIRAVRLEERVRLVVEDNGPGMPEEVRARCLEPYYTTRGQKGTGLGLALVDQIVRSTGGEVEIDSSPGSGTRVALTFPIAGAAGAAAGVEPRERAGAPIGL